MPCTVTFRIGVVIYIRVGFGIRDIFDGIGFIKVSVWSCYVDIPVTGIFIFPPDKLAAVIIGPVVFGANGGCFGDGMV